MSSWQTPKTNWGQPGQTVPIADDFNRIEGNIQHLQDTKETPAGAQAKAEAAAEVVRAELNAHANASAPHAGHALLNHTHSDYALKTHNHNGVYEPVLSADRKRKITISTSDPSGGSDGDIWIKY